MLRRLSHVFSLSSVAGGAVFSGLYLANWLTVTDDPVLKRYRDLPKPLAVPCLDSSAAATLVGPHSQVYRGAPLPAPQGGSIPMPNPADTTLVLTLEETCRRFSGQRAMAVRPLEKLTKETRMIDGKPKSWDVYHYGPTRHFTYGELWEHIEACGRGLMSLGLSPDARVALCEDTRMEWFVSCYGVWYAGAVGCTVYANMNADALEYALAQMCPTHVICNGNNLHTFISYFSRADHAGPVPTFIYTDSFTGNECPKGFVICSYEELLARGRASTEVPRDPHTPDEVALIMYTSGTTGKPKGVMVTHANILHTIHSIGSAMDHLFGNRSDITYLAYLPLAHILEFVCENTLLHRGMLIAYGSPRTLTDISAIPHGDLKEFRPHFMCGVPRVFDSIRKTVYDKLSGNDFARFIFDAAYNDKVKWMRRGKDTPLYNRLIFDKVRANLGGRVEALLSGGAPLSPKVQQFMQTTVTPSMIQGYGLTETCACTTIQYPGDRTKKCVGLLMPGVEAVLRDCGEWKHTDTPEPRGELLVRGDTVTKGYFQYPRKTAEVFLEGGWFATGDIASITPDGSLRIVGRAESLIKNANGEYIAVEALEAVYSLHPLANPNSVCVVVDQHKDYICGIVLTDMRKTMTFAASHGIKGSWPDILKDSNFRTAVVASFRKAGKHARLRPFELLADVALLYDEWTPENGCLTAAMKMKRNVILDRYPDVIKELFKK